MQKNEHQRKSTSVGPPTREQDWLMPIFVNFHFFAFCVKTNPTDLELGCPRDPKNPQPAKIVTPAGRTGIFTFLGVICLWKTQGISLAFKKTLSGQALRHRLLAQNEKARKKFCPENWQSATLFLVSKLKQCLERLSDTKDLIMIRKWCARTQLLGQ